jgi:hypothetical protein
MKSGARVAALWLACTPLAAQEAPKEVAIRTHPYTPPSAVLRANTSLVETPLVVRDPSGRTVPGLHAGDFDVLDDGVPRKIVSFAEVRPVRILSR